MALTQAAWDKLWWAEFKLRRKRNPTATLQEVHGSTRRAIIAKYGPRPEGEPGPPWWTRLAAPALGVSMDKITTVWDWMNGKKTFVGAIITVVATIATALPVILPIFISDAATVAQVCGVALTVVGVLHKIYKFVYREDHVDPNDPTDQKK